MNSIKHIDPDTLWSIAGRSMAAALSRAPGFVSRAAPGAWRVTSGVDTWMANWLACYGADPVSLGVFREGFDDAVASGRTASVVLGAAVREQVEPMFAGRPVVSEGVDAMMWRDARPIPRNPKPYPGQVTDIRAGSDLADVLALVARPFEVDEAGTRLALAGAIDEPAMRMFTATSDALDSVCMTWSEADLTYIYLMATDAGRERRGAGWTVLAWAMEEAMREGASLFFLEASGAGEELYRQIGYEIYELANFWVVNEKPEG